MREWRNCKFAKLSRLFCVKFKVFTLDINIKLFGLWVSQLTELNVKKDLMLMISWSKFISVSITYGVRVQIQ